MKNIYNDAAGKQLPAKSNTQSVRAKLYGFAGIAAGGALLLAGSAANAQSPAAHSFGNTVRPHYAQTAPVPVPARMATPPVPRHLGPGLAAAQRVMPTASPTPRPTATPLPTPAPVWTPAPRFIARPDIYYGPGGGVMPGVTFTKPAVQVSVHGMEVRPHVPQEPVRPAIGATVTFPAPPETVAPDPTKPSVDTTQPRP